MDSTANDRRDAAYVTIMDETCESADAPDWKLRRWLVSFRSGAESYSVGEFIAFDAAAAIERAVDIFGPGQEPKAEEIPWDAAPLPRISSMERR